MDQGEGPPPRQGELVELTGGHLPIGGQGFVVYRAIVHGGLALGVGDIQLLDPVGFSCLGVLGGVGGRSHGLFYLAGGVGAADVPFAAPGADDDLGLQGPDQLDQIGLQGLVGPALLHVLQITDIVVQKAAQEGGFPIAQGPEGPHRLAQGQGVPGGGLKDLTVLAKEAEGGFDLILSRVQGDQSAQLLKEGLGLAQDHQHIRLLHGVAEAEELLGQGPVEDPQGAEGALLRRGKDHLSAGGVQLVSLKGGGGGRIGGPDQLPPLV